MDTIKCGRKVYELQDGDAIMDNGKTYQLILKSEENTPSYRRKPSPKVSKKNFQEYVKNPKVEKQNYGQPGVFLYVYKA